MKHSEMVQDLNVMFDYLMDEFPPMEENDPIFIDVFGVKYTYSYIEVKHEDDWEIYILHLLQVPTADEVSLHVSQTYLENLYKSTHTLFTKFKNIK